MDEQDVADGAYRYLRAHTRGELRYGEQLDRIRYVIAPGGELVWPATAIMLDAADTVLLVPKNVQGSMELLVTLSELDPDGPAGDLTDRWRIYHLDPHEVRWATASIDTARFESQVIDGVGLMRVNVLAPAESRLCRWINREHAEPLRAVCRHYTGGDVEAPLVVGVDPGGFDVRRRFDVVRLEAPEPMDSPEAVEQTFAQMIQEAGAAGRPAT